MKIRSACQKDAQQLVSIYAPYVKNTAITFEYEVPSIKDFEKRINTTLKKFPYLIAEEEGIIQGYAYASTYYDRSAYDWTAELSVYVKEDARKKQVGSQLYDALEAALQKAGFVNLLACITLSNEASLAFHKKRGYDQVAHFKKIGYKFDKWYDIVWLQKRL
ncbi:GNAT family N-acetyltransferase [Streptococcus macacae]|uniref:Acetyltransferase, GNAT family n=1 Tax=Streptococcus macacae NCTC 11558 TaxID=764298 RepID=G5JUC3_9STRE|nr:GNAT family N-acetyltransferase [Streptococcus macacae]EHJ52035.1 acetyltransferase, GNAT family [Streptococcus macacae NCTC 11558]SUN78486.1 acetyltransferase [Streptococcus macacae NCTC 11558]